MPGNADRAAIARTASEAAAAGRYIGGLAAFLRRPLRPGRARALVETAQRRREQSFLTLLERAVFHPGGASPYRALLRHARFDLERIATAVRRGGVEEALDRLYDAGVRLSLDEFKGRRPILRAGLELVVRAEDFDNPLTVNHFAAQTGGSTARPRRVMIDLAEVTHEAAHLELLLEGIRATDRPQAGWFSPPPAVAGIKWVLRHAKRGRPPDRWFAQRPVSMRRGEASFGLFTAATHATGLALGTRLPWPRHTPPSEAERVARWLGEHRARGRPAMLRTYPSSAVRACQAAEREGIDIAGTVFSLVGEPCTPGKQAAIAAAGGRVVCSYFITEAGQIGTACTSRRPVDDMHVLTDRVSLCVRRREPVPGRSVDAIFVTTLALSAPKILLNVETGDHGVLEPARCSCPTGALGLAQHLHSVRSYEKLVGEGMNFLAVELLEILEEELPGRFGGVATDYQLLEDEREGLPRLWLLVHPRLGPIDERAVGQATISRLAAGGHGSAMMAEVWRLSETLQVVRREPERTPPGKTQLLVARRR